MEFVNDTPFEPFTFQSLDLEDEAFQVILIKGAFEIVPGDTLRAGKPKTRIETTEVYRAGPTSSLRQGSDLAPFKLATDIVIEASAHSPGGKHERQWPVAVHVGQVHKQFVVTGPRSWRFVTGGGWRLDVPEPTTEVPVIYENAFGGTRVVEDGLEAFEANPVGVGFVNIRDLDESRPVRAPSVVGPDAVEIDLGQHGKVEGLGPLGRAWLPRRAYAGTYDDAWVRERRPRLPHDFDFRFHNCAHPDLIYPGYLRGDERVRLENLCRGVEILEFQLPRIIVAVAITDDAGYRYGGCTRLDTLHVDVPAMRVSIGWRLALPRFEDGVARIDAATFPMLPLFEFAQARS